MKSHYFDYIKIFPPFCHPLIHGLMFWLTQFVQEHASTHNSPASRQEHFQTSTHSLYVQYRWASYRHATILWGESVFLKRKSVSIRIIHQCIDISRHFVFAGDSHRDAVCKKIPILRNKIKITILLLSLIHCYITLMFQFVCTIWPVW